ncbi:hypothetical protein FRB99_003527, partial [Tulasnella sp. 403]
TLKKIAVDVERWKNYGFVYSWYHQNEIEDQIHQHEAALMQCIHQIQLAAILQTHRGVEEIINQNDQHAARMEELQEDVRQLHNLVRRWGQWYEAESIPNPVAGNVTGLTDIRNASRDSLHTI